MRKINTIMSAVTLSALSFLFLAPNAFAEVTGDPENAPSDIALSEIMVNENAPNGTFVATVTATDPDTAIEDLTFFIPNDAGERFIIVEGNQLQVLSGNEYLDYELNTTHDIKILVRDPEWNTYDEQFTILVQNKNESPTDILFDSTAVDELAEAGTVIGTLSVVDPDSGDSFVYTMTNDSDGRFAIANDDEVVVVDGTMLLAESYDIAVKVTDAVGNTYDKYLSVDVNPIQAPVLSAITVGTNEDGDTTLSWTTDKDAKSRVDYGMVGDMDELTFFTKNYSLDQEVAIADLLDCVAYEYRPRSSDRFGKERLGVTTTLTTSGCTGDAVPLDETQVAITPADGGVAQLLDVANKGVVVNLPDNFILAEGDVQLQMKRIQVGAVLQAAGTPDENMYVVGNGMYDLQIVQDTDTNIPNFQNEVAVTFSYTDGEISMLDESSIMPFRWNGSFWDTIHGGCKADALNNTITCQTDQFSTFGLFGYMNEIAQSFSGKAKTLRRRGMAREDFRGVAVEGGVNKSNFETAYQNSLDEIAMINAGEAGGAQVAINEEGEKVFLGYKAGRSGVQQIEDTITRRSAVAYRGSTPRSSAMLARQDASLKSRLAKMKGGLLAKSSVQKKAEEEQELALSMATKFDKTQSLLQMYQMANEEIALCLSQGAGFCDEIYRYLASEIASREKEMIDHLMQNNSNWD
jgi:hypothetical protein